MSYSKLVSHVNLSPHCSKPRGAKIDKITIHYMAGDAKVEAVGNWFARKSTKASSNYGIGSDGRIACYVEEENSAWTSSSSANDSRAITIEVANYKDSSISDKAWASLIDLCVDVCKRYAFRLNFTGDKTGNLTMHKWFADTSCPGKWLEERFPLIAEEVNRRLDAAQETPEEQHKPNVFYRVQVGAFREKTNGERSLAKLKAAGYTDAFLVEVVTEPEKPRKTIDELAREVILGLWGSGSDRVKRLTSAGYDSKAVQDRVNELM